MNYMKGTPMSFSQKFEVQLNKDTKVILMKPGQDLFLRFAPKMDKVMKTLFGTEEGKMSWVEDPEKYAFVTSVVKPILLYCVRDPFDYKKRLIVDNDQRPSANQEYYDDFNPAFDAKVLKAQDLYSGDENEKVLTPQLTLFFIILRKSGWLNIPSEEEEVETFPDEQSGNVEDANSGVVQNLSEEAQ